MTVKALIKLLLDQDLDAEVFFELQETEEGDVVVPIEPVLIRVEDVILLYPPVDEKEFEGELPMLILTSNVLHPDPRLN